MFRLVLSLIFVCGAGALLAQTAWRELDLPTMHVQVWGQPGIKGSTWVVPQDSGVVGISQDNMMTAVHRRVDAGMRRFTHAVAIDTNRAVVAGNNGLMYRTRDGGESWVPVLWDAPSAIRAMVMTSRGNILVIGSDAEVYISSNGGLTFSDTQSMLPSIVDHVIGSMTGDTLFAYGSQCPGILVSTDEGATWVRWEEPTSGIPRDFNVCKDGSLVLLDENSVIWMRSSPGVPWERSELKFTDGWYRIASASRDTIVVVGRSDAGEMVLSRVVRASEPWGEYWNGQVIPSSPEWFKDAQYRSTKRGMLMLGSKASVLVGYDLIQVVMSQPDLRAWPLTIGATKAGYPLLCGTTNWDLPYVQDSYTVWFAKYVGDTVLERVIVVHSGAGLASWLAGGAINPSLEPDEAIGMIRCYVTGSDTKMIYSDEDGRKWSVVPTAPNDSRINEIKRILKLGEHRWLMSYAFVAGKGVEASMTFYTSSSQGRTWDSVVIPIDLPVQPRGVPGFTEVQAYGANSVFCNIALMDDQDLVIPVDIDLERRRARSLTVRPRRGEWTIERGRYLLNRYQIWNVGRTWATGYLETYDIQSDTKLNGLSTMVDPLCNLGSGAYSLGDTMFATYGWCSRIFLTEDAGMTWNERALPDLDSGYIWNYWAVRRLRPGVYIAGAKGLAASPFNRVSKLLVFTPSWDPIPVSVDSSVRVAPQSSPSVVPNPSRDGLLTIDLPDDLEGPLTWSIVDMLGRTVAEGTADTMTGRRIMPGRALSAGGYTFMLQSRTGRRTARFVVLP